MSPREELAWALERHYNTAVSLCTEHDRWLRVADMVIYRENTARSEGEK